MQIAKFCKKHENCILALAAVACMMLVVGLRFDYYYQANDDIYIKNILSGAYTGTPESHNIQMHYLLSLLLSLLYRIAGSLPVYGLFLCVCHYGAGFMIFVRSAKMMRKTWSKAMVVALESLVSTGLLLSELVFMQYTVTCTFLAAAATFRFYTTDADLSVKEFIKANISNILLVTLAFLVRSEMLLLLLPLICATGLFKWFTHKPVFTKENAAKYLSVIGLIIAGIAVGQITHMLAYGSDEWRTFNRFFDERTKLYDYQFIPEYESNKDFYDGIGLKISEQELLVNYNFGLNEDITADTLKATAEYAVTLKGEDISFAERFKIAFADYKYKLTHESDYPFNVMVLAAYALLILLAWKNKSYSYIFKIPFLAFVRTGLWMYIMMGNRYPTRITHSLYFMEFVILAALIFEECLKEYANGQEKYKTSPALVRGWQSSSYSILVVTILGILGMISYTYHADAVSAECRQRDYANREINALTDYCNNNPDNFYFVDVYSAVSCSDYVMSDVAIEYSEKAFANVDNSLDNYDLMGGWVVKSPLTAKKLKNFDMEAANGISAMERGLLDTEDVCVIIKSEKNMDWLVAYYAEKADVDVTVQPIDEIELDGKSLFTVYEVK